MTLGILYPRYRIAVGRSIDAREPLRVQTKRKTELKGGNEFQATENGQLPHVTVDTRIVFHLV